MALMRVGARGKEARLHRGYRLDEPLEGRRPETRGQFNLRPWLLHSTGSPLGLEGNVQSAGGGYRHYKRHGVSLVLRHSGQLMISPRSITKSPDQGPFWFPLSTAGSFVYADSFVAPVSGPVTDIGIWLTNSTGDTSAQPLVFEVLGSAGGGGPDTTNVLATTGALTLDVTTSLSLFSESTTSSVNLIAGDTYWVAGDEVGLSGGGKVQVNGTFWFSNDPSGVSFSGPNPVEMAFTVTLSC
jgi:hypothetical protein